MLQEARATRGLSENNLRVLYALQRANGPLTAYQILDRLKKHGVSGPTTVYRALHSLVLDGTVHRIETLMPMLSALTLRIGPRQHSLFVSSAIWSPK